jgi:RimJ/RimL family protein N-acetyltransferase
MSDPFWQPTLEGSQCFLRPLLPEDFDALYDAARDPSVWEQHPVPDRYTLDKFKSFFEGALKSKGALAVVSKSTSQPVGTTRYVDWDATKKSVEIGYTFLAKSLWGTGLNREIKVLMMAHAMLKAQQIIFRVGEENRRSQRALEKLGILPNELRIMVEVEGNLKRYCVFEVSKNQWAELSKEGGPLFLFPNHMAERNR